MKSLIKEFKDFAVKGNVMDLAIGVVIGSAFSKIVSSLVADIITPPIGLVVGGADFSHLAVHLVSPLPGTEVVTINYGLFLESVFDFVIIAFALFLVIKGMNALKRRFEREQKTGVAPKAADVVVLEEIRDILKNNQPKPDFTHGTKQ